MKNEEELLELLRRIEANQIKGLEVQSEFMARAKAQMVKTEAMFGEALTLQRAAVQRQQRTVRMILPVILLLIGIVFYIGFKWHVF